MSITLELTLTGQPIPTWLTGVTTIRYREHDHHTAARYEQLHGGGYDPTTIVIDPRRFVSLRLLGDNELAPFRDEINAAA